VSGKHCVSNLDVYRLGSTGESKGYHDDLRCDPPTVRLGDGSRIVTAYVFVDETKERGYLVAAAIVRPEHLAAARQAIRATRPERDDSALHDALLQGRAEERGALLVLPDNVPARAAYHSWGWYQIGELQPFADAPVCL
jgi:hypothetical protein